VRSVPGLAAERRTTFSGIGRRSHSPRVCHPL